MFQGKSAKMFNVHQEYTDCITVQEFALVLGQKCNTIVNQQFSTVQPTMYLSIEHESELYLD